MMNRITPLQAIARNRRDALAKVTFRDRLMAVEWVLVENKNGHT